MEFQVDLAFNTTEEIQASSNLPDVRVFYVGQHNGSDTLSSLPLARSFSSRQ